MRRKVERFRDRRVALLARAIAELCAGGPRPARGALPVLAQLAVAAPGAAAGDE